MHLLSISTIGQQMVIQAQRDELGGVKVTFKRVQLFPPSSVVVITNAAAKKYLKECADTVKLVIRASTPVPDLDLSSMVDSDAGPASSRSTAGSAQGSEVKVILINEKDEKTELVCTANDIDAKVDNLFDGSMRVATGQIKGKLTENQMLVIVPVGAAKKARHD